MKRLICLSCSLLCLLMPLTTVARDLSEAEYSHLLDLILEARPAAAAALLDSLAVECAGEPVYLLARARILLEDIPVDEADKEVTKVMAQDLLVLMEECIEVCDARLRAGTGDLEALTLNRGWAWMMKSQAHALGHSFWSAGRDAGKAKKDLDKYLASHPNHPVANGLLGAFLYFTDAVPEVIQMLSKLAMMPTGDRQRGLRMLEVACATNNPLLNDWRMLNLNVSIYFEGRLEEGLPYAEQLHDDFPAYARLALAPAVGRIWAPAQAAAYGARVDQTVALAEARAEGGEVKPSLWMARFYRAWGDRLLVGSAAARETYEAIVAAAPVRPDWVLPMARFKLVELAAQTGRRSDAIDGVAEILADEDLKLVHKLARGLREGLDQAVSATLVVDWFRAEEALQAGDLAAAEGLYRAISGQAVPIWLLDYRLLATIRVAELKAGRGEYRSGARWLQRALKYYYGTSRMDWIIKARSRYFNELAKQGDELPTAGILFSHS